MIKGGSREGRKGHEEVQKFEERQDQGGFMGRRSGLDVAYRGHEEEQKFGEGQFLGQLTYGASVGLQVWTWRGGTVVASLN